MATYEQAYATYDPGKANADIFARFQQKHGRQATEADINAFKAANQIDWSKPLSQQSYDQANAWIDAYNANPAAQTTPTAPVTPAPTLALDRMTRPDRFTPRQFIAPTMADVEADPGYAFGKQEVINTVGNSASAAGLARSPQAREALIQRVGDYAAGRYADVYDRRFNEWREGLGADERAYATNFGVDTAVTGFNNEAAISEFEPRYNAWDRGQDRAWQREIYGKDSAYRDKVFDANEYWRRRDDYWRDRDEGESRRRFLAQLGVS